MQPHDKERPDEIDAGWAALEYHQMGLTMTDDDVREMGHKEYKPGYFEDDPRYPGWNVKDRYLYDHPGPDWKTKPPVVRGVDDLVPNHSFGRVPPQPRYRPKKLEPAQDGKPPVYSAAWDDDLLQLDPAELVPEGVTPVEKTLRVPRPETYNLRPEADRATIPVQATAGKFSGIWLCRSCRKQPALWPHEKAWRWKIWGVTGTIVFRSPLACTDCRVFNFRVIQALGRQDHRPFWKNVIALVEGDSFMFLPNLTRLIARVLHRQYVPRKLWRPWTW